VAAAPLQRHQRGARQSGALHLPRQRQADPARPRPRPLLPPEAAGRGVVESEPWSHRQGPTLPETQVWEALLLFCVFIWEFFEWFEFGMFF